MATYTVHVPRTAGDPATRADGTAFVRDGFSVGAFLFGPVYLLRHRAVLAAGAWVLAVLAIGWVAHLLRLPLPAEIGLAVLIMVFTGLEASSIRRFALYRRGLAATGLVRARTLEEGEAAFFAAEALPVSQPVSGTPRPGRATPTGIIGLFPESGA